MRSSKKPLFSYRGYAQALFFLVLILYVWFFPSDHLEGTWMDSLMDSTAIGLLISGELLRLWAVSHAGKCTRSRSLKAPLLVTTGPYAYLRHPIYLGNFLIGLGMVIVAEAFIFMPIFLALFAWQYRVIVSEEERFLSEKFGAEFERYRARVPKYLPIGWRFGSDFAFGTHFPLKELGTVWGIVVGAFFFEWIESPLHRQWILNLYHWLMRASAL